MLRIDNENIVELVKTLDTTPNYGYIVEDAVYSEALPDSDDSIDYYEYEENCLVSRNYSFFKNIPSILIEMDYIIDGGHLRFAENHPSSLFNITNFSVYEDTMSISYTITDEYEKIDDIHLKQEYHTFRVKKLNESGCEALEPNWLKWNKKIYFENIESLLRGSDGQI